MAKQGTVTNASTGKQTIVIAAPKSGMAQGATPSKIITTVPKVAGQAVAGGSGTQFIVVTTRPGGSTAGGVQTVTTLSSTGLATRGRSCLRLACRWKRGLGLKALG